MFYSRIPPHVFWLIEYAKEMTVYFIYNNCINFIHTWGNLDRLIKVAPSAIKVTPFDRVTLIGLWFRISSKQLIITYGKGIELKANNYHIFLRAVAAVGRSAKSETLSKYVIFTWLETPQWRDFRIGSFFKSCQEVLEIFEF